MLGEKSWDEMPLHSITQLSAASGEWSLCIPVALPSPRHKGDIRMTENNGPMGRPKHPPTNMVQMHRMRPKLHRQLASPSQHECNHWHVWCLQCPVDKEPDRMQDRTGVHGADTSAM